LFKDIIDGEEQIVAGIIFRIRFRLGETSCEKSVLRPEYTQDQIKQNCPVTAQEPIECTVTFQYKPWLPDVQLLNTDGSKECIIPEL
jgi:hypothetical protein